MKFFIVALLLVAFVSCEDDHHEDNHEKPMKAEKLCPGSPCDDIRVNVTVDQVKILKN
jgi:hypothetical protein